MTGVSLKERLPKPVLDAIRRVRKSFATARVRRLPSLTEERVTSILRNDLGLINGSTVFVHSSIDKLNLAFPFYRLLGILRTLVGEEGTLIFPTYPSLPSYLFLQRGEIFDILKTPSYTGVLSEFARRQRTAVRSLHPTKSVCALGPLAQQLTSTHHLSPFPYDTLSPYYQIVPQNGIIIGLGVSTKNLSFVHCADDYLKERFPVFPYLQHLFDAPCVDPQGKKIIVRTYAHDPRKMNHHIPAYMKRHAPASVCQDLTVDGASFFRASSKPLFDLMVNLAEQGITIYPKQSYK